MLALLLALLLYSSWLSRMGKNYWTIEKGQRRPVEFLQSRGYILNKDWSWSPPKKHNVTRKEKEAIRFLVQHFLFAGLKSDKPEPYIKRGENE